MKNIRFLLLFTTALFLGSCESDDKLNRETGNYIKFSVAGSLMDGVYHIEENEDDEFSQGIVTGIIVPNGNGESFMTLGFTDNSQKLSVTFSIPARKGLMELTDDIEMGMSITNQNPNNMGDDYTILASKSVSLNITELETTNLGFLSTIKRAKGHFNGIMIYQDNVTGQEFSHTVTGDFLINKFF